jgi:hypothetical protein
MFDQMRRDAEASIALGGMQVGLPKVRVDASQLLALLNHHDASREEIDRLSAALDKIKVRAYELGAPELHDMALNALREGAQ